jgi:hypothetical protein
MSPRVAFLLIIGACSVGFLAAWLLFRSSHAEALERVQAERAARLAHLEERSPRTSPQPPELELPDSRVPALTERPEDPEPAPSKPTSELANLIRSPDPRTLPEDTLIEMKVKREAIQDTLGLRSQPIIMQRFKDGLSEHLSDEHTWSGGTSDSERAEIFGIQMVRDGGTDRTVLPREQYPELYALKDETLRLDALISAEEVRVAMEAAAAK